ncbi:hypothetical protein QTN25_005889 [Entamoeba marina]
MLVFFALLALTSAEVITVASVLTNDYQIDQFHMYEIGVCYLYSNKPKYVKVVKNGDGYKYSWHSLSNCSDIGSETSITNFIEGEIDYAYGHFVDDINCTYATTNEVNISYIYFTSECVYSVSTLGNSYIRTLDGTTVTSKRYSTDNCTGIISSISITNCDVCSNYGETSIYNVCGEQTPVEESSSMTSSSIDSEIITEIHTTLDDNEPKYFYMYELDTCYLSSSSSHRYLKVVKNGDKYKKTLHFEDDCSDEGAETSMGGNSSYRYVLNGTSVVIEHYSSKDCSGNGKIGDFVETICDVCDDDVYTICGESGPYIQNDDGATLPTIILVVLIIIMII